MEKPRYSTSKRMLWFSLIAAWGLIYLLAFAAGFRESVTVTSFATVVVPFTFALIVALLGVHRGFGSLDMRAMLRQRPMPREQPEVAAPLDPATGGAT